MFTAALLASQDVERAWMSIDTWLDKGNVAYNTFKLQKEGNSRICNNMDGLWGYCAKWNKPVTQGQILHDFPYLMYLKESES